MAAIVIGDKMGKAGSRHVSCQAGKSLQSRSIKESKDSTICVHCYVGGLCKPLTSAEYHGIRIMDRC